MAQDVLQDAAVPVVFKLIDSIDTADQRNALEATVSRDDLGDQPLVRLKIAMQPADRDLLIALHAERLPGGAFFEHQWHHAHAYQIGAMDAFERLRDHRAHAEQNRALGSPVAR
jgi:hypothetical protein